MNAALVKIRKACINDLDSLLAIEQTNYARWNINIFTEELTNPHSYTYVAETAKKLIGFLTIWLINQEIEIQNIAILSEYHRQGIGSLLISRLNDLIKKHNIFTIYLEVREKNVAAISFYQKMGFSKYNLRKNYYQDDHAVLMKKIINHEN